MQAQQHFGIGVAEMVYQAVVQSAEAGAGRQRHELQIERAHHLRQVIAAPGRGFGRRCIPLDRPFNIHSLHPA